MTATAVRCPKCDRRLPGGIAGATGLHPCPGCASPVGFTVFPAYFRDEAGGSAGERVVEPGEASCFYHPGKKAVVPCDRCGRFLCALCDLDLGGEHVCPQCLESKTVPGAGPAPKPGSLERERVRYDNVALALAVLPVLVWPFTLFTAPAALFIAFRFWKTPVSILPRSKVRFVVAIALALLQLAGWGLLLVKVLRL